MGRLAIENCNRTMGLNSPLLRHSQDPSASVTDPAPSSSKPISHMRLSTEALLRFELAHKDYHNAPGHQTTGDDAESMKSGSTGIDSTMHDSESVGLPRVNSSRSLGSSNDSVEDADVVANNTSIKVFGDA